MPNQTLHRSLIEKIPVTSTDRVALLSAQHRETARILAARAAQLTIHDIDFAALRQIEHRLAPAANLTVMHTPFPAPQPVCTKAVMISPKGRDFARAQIWSSYTSLEEGGQLYLLGANDEGIKSLIADAGEVFTTARTLAYKNRHRLGVAHKLRADAVFPEAWGAPPAHMQTRTLQTPRGPLQISTMPGVFSWQALDDGTAFLLAQPQVSDFAASADVLDMGCGAGVIGCALGHAARSVQMVDVNLLAVECARASAQLNDLPHAAVYPSDVYSEVPPVSFDLIVSNPPFHKGFELTQNIASQIITGAPAHLKPGGRLVLVANAFLPYEALMQAHLTSVHVLAQDNRYKVLVGQKP